MTNKYSLRVTFQYLHVIESLQEHRTAVTSKLQETTNLVFASRFLCFGLWIIGKYENKVISRRLSYHHTLTHILAVYVIDFCFLFYLVFYFFNFKIFNSYMRSQTWTPLPTSVFKAITKNNLRFHHSQFKGEEALRKSQLEKAYINKYGLASSSLPRSNPSIFQLLTV